MNNYFAGQGRIYITYDTSSTEEDVEGVIRQKPNWIYLGNCPYFSIGQSTLTLVCEEFTVDTLPILFAGGDESPAGMLSMRDVGDFTNHIGSSKSKTSFEFGVHSRSPLMHLVYEGLNTFTKNLNPMRIELDFVRFNKVVGETPLLSDVMAESMITGTFDT